MKTIEYDILWEAQRDRPLAARVRKRVKATENIAIMVITSDEREASYKMDLKKRNAKRAFQRQES